MDRPRLSVALTIDHDAISDSIRRLDPPVKRSHAEFGPRVGAKRILAMLERRGIISGYEGSKPRRVLVSESELHTV
jgi:hypothetical protein